MEVELAVAVALGVVVGVGVPARIVTVAPVTGNPENPTACPLVPAPPVILNW